MYESGMALRWYCKYLTASELALLFCGLDYIPIYGYNREPQDNQSEMAYLLDATVFLGLSACQYGVCST